MSAGDGYRYLLKSVVAGDGDRSLSTPLTRYYTEAGAPPGFWMGSGLWLSRARRAGRGRAGLRGSATALDRDGHDPITGDPLGRAYQQFAPIAERVKQRVDALDPELGPAARAIRRHHRGRGSRARNPEGLWRGSTSRSVSRSPSPRSGPSTPARNRWSPRPITGRLQSWLRSSNARLQQPGGRRNRPGRRGCTRRCRRRERGGLRLRQPLRRPATPHACRQQQGADRPPGRWRTLAGPMHSAVVAVSTTRPWPIG